MDLSLTRVLCAVYETGSVSRAADVLFVSQPAVSHALGRLRREIGDELFVRTGSVMQPTSRAIQLYNAFREAISLVEAAVEERKHFDPAKSHRRFRFSMTDLGEMVFLPPILEHLQVVAPDITIEVRQIAMAELLRALEVGQIDFAIGNLPELNDDTNHSLIFDEVYSCLLRKGHPALAGSELSFEAFKSIRRVTVASPFSGHRRVEDELRAQGLTKMIALEIPHFTSVPEIILKTDLVIALPSRVAKFFAQTRGLKAVPLPFPISPFKVRIHWHERNRHDPGHHWLQECLHSVLGNI
ncbi:LysR family transcriptional regulator [Agrobacterium sp. 22-209-1]